MGTRGQRLTLTRPKYRTAKRNKFFNARIINKGHGLLEIMVSGHSVNTLKNRYDWLKTELKRRGNRYEL